VLIYITRIYELHFAARLVVAGGISRNFGILADRDFAISPPSVSPFLSDFENNGTVEFSEFFCVGWGSGNKFLGLLFKLLQTPLGSLICDVDYPKRHIYDVSAINTKLMFCVDCSWTTNYPPFVALCSYMYQKSLNIYRCMQLSQAKMKVGPV